MWRSHSVIFLLAALWLTGGLSPALADGQALSFGRQDPAATRNGAMLKSLLWPGLGQIAQGRAVRGSVWAGGAVTLLAGSFFTHMQYNSAATDYENTVASMLRTSDLDKAKFYRSQLDGLHTKADDRYQYRQMMEVGLVLWWVGSLVDTWFFTGRDGRGSLSARGGLPGSLEPVVKQGAPGLGWYWDF